MISPLIAVALTAITSVVASIGPAVAEFCASVLPRLAPLLEKGMDILRMVEKIADTVSHAMGIFTGTDTTGDVGDRALQASDKGITPDQFENHADYMNALRHVDLDPDKSAKLTDVQKVISGLAVAGHGLDDKFGSPEGTMGNLFWLAAANPEYFNADKLTQYLKTGQDIMSIVDYFDGKLGGGESLEVEDGLVQLDKSINPDADEKSIREQIYAAADTVQGSDR